MATPEFLRPRLLEAYTSSELDEIGRKVAEATLPGLRIGDVLREITTNRAEYLRFDIALAVVTRAMSDHHISLSDVEKVEVFGHIDEDGDAADVTVRIIPKKNWSAQ